MTTIRHFGYVEDRAYSDAHIAKIGTDKLMCQHFAKNEEKRDVGLWKYVLARLPKWRRGTQGIGDCVSWATELALTTLMAKAHGLGRGLFEGEAATEAIYGGCRVEARGLRSGGYQDGATGSWASEWVTSKGGVILRRDYSKITGNPEHDLTTYDSDKAKEWGNFGCGGRSDKGALDIIAAKMPVLQTTLATDVMMAAAAIQNGYPILICSDVGFGDMKRDRQGIVRRSGTWMHAMLLNGVRWRSGEPDFRDFQSWGDSCSGPDPGIEDEAVSACSWWVVSEDADRIFSRQDSYIISDVSGMPPQKLDAASLSAAWDLS